MLVVPPAVAEIYRCVVEGRVVYADFRDSLVAKITKQRSPAAPTIADLEERERIDKARERRHIREGMTQSAIRATLGPPSDRRQRPTNWGWGDCWTYPPAPLDAQTRTVLCFDNLDLRLVTIDRAIER